LVGKIEKWEKGQRIAKAEQARRADDPGTAGGLPCPQKDLGGRR